MAKETLLTKEGLERLQKELQHLKTVRRKQVSEKIKEARKYGDIAENSEYDNAKNEQAFVEGRIKDIENILRNAKLIEEDNSKAGGVNIGNTVELKDMETGEIFTYTLVGSAEADPSENKISNESPVGQALLGKEAGTILKVDVPAGIVAYKIMKVQKK